MNALAADWTPPEITVGDRLRRARLNAGYKSQDVFAAALRERGVEHISQSTVGSWENNGRKRLDMTLIRAWADLTNVTVDWLILGCFSNLELVALPTGQMELPLGRAPTLSLA